MPHSIDTCLPIWQNMHVDHASITKRPNRFLLSEDCLPNASSIEQWAIANGDSYHFVIILVASVTDHKSPIPYKLYASWLEDPKYCRLVHSHWTPFNPSLKASTTK